eukprot:COSAG01_NODE_5771_length_4043_cov_30.383114_1_plen_69_part_10
MTAVAVGNIFPRDPYSCTCTPSTKGNCILKYSSYWSMASPQLHGPKAKPDSASKLKALRGVVVTQTELL